MKLRRKLNRDSVYIVKFQRKMQLATQTASVVAVDEGHAESIRQQAFRFMVDAGSSALWKPKDRAAG
jgi:hypothetical protein